MAEILASYSESNFDTNTYTLINGGNTRIGVVFTPSESYALYSCKWYLKKNSGETGNAVAKLYAQSSGVPTGSALATSSNFDVSTLFDSSFTVIEILFPAGQNYELSSATQYCMELQFSGSNGIQAGVKYTTGGFNFTYISSYATDTNRKLCYYVYGTIPTVDYTLTASSTTINITDVPATITSSRSLISSTTSIIITGVNIILNRGLEIICASTSIIITPINILINSARSLITSSTSIVITRINILLRWTELMLKPFKPFVSIFNFKPKGNAKHYVLKAKSTSIKIKAK